MSHPGTVLLSEVVRRVTSQSGGGKVSPNGWADHAPTARTAVLSVRRQDSNLRPASGEPDHHALGHPAPESLSRAVVVCSKLSGKRCP